MVKFVECIILCLNVRARVGCMVSRETWQLAMLNDEDNFILVMSC